MPRKEEKKEEGSTPVSQNFASYKGEGAPSVPESDKNTQARVRVLTTLGRDASEKEKNTFYMMYKYEDPTDHRRFMRFGKEGLVAMTEAQYKRLLQ